MTDLPAPKIPGATYRLQFNYNFTFRRAADILSYLHDLGITDIYASPYFKARQGSLHGYDIVDHNALNPEIGTEEDYKQLITELHRHGMGQLLDIVPNHMCIECSENHWWMDVLENGQASPYAKYFDVDWSPVKKELLNKVLIPVLGDQYGKVLEAQELRLAFEEGAFFVYYYDHKYPVMPTTYDSLLGHRIQDLQERLTEEHPDLAELLSIMTAMKHLPSSTATDTANIGEWHREKEVIKRRLAALFTSSAEIKAHIEENLRRFNGTKGDPRSFDLLDELLGRQIYRLSHWRVATEEINYRRFFDINGMGAIRVEHPEVFASVHRLIFRFVREGSVTGLRVDHPDGLYNPLEYFHALQRGCFVNQILGQTNGGEDDPPAADTLPDTERELAEQYNQAVSANPEYKPFYIVGEKILTKSERMPSDWPIFSTTGYVFLNSVNGLFIDGENAGAFDAIYEKFIRAKINFPDVIYDKKKLVMHVAMASEVNTLGRYLNDISEKNRHTRDFTLNSLRSAIVEVIACFPVYRTYINAYQVHDSDVQYIEFAVSRAKRRNPVISESIFDFLKDVLLLRFPDDFNDGDRGQWLDFVMKFQQFTGPAMAKGVEDTALCVYNRLVSLNDVGSMPDRFGTPLETFHGQNMERIKNWPHALIATSTHDTKRSEGVRTRIDVLSEIPHEWGKKVRSWAIQNRKKKTIIEGTKAPDRNDEYLLYQTLVGAWPVETPEGPAYNHFIQRIKDYMLKEAREAKVNTSWINSNKAYEDALLAFIDAILRSPDGNPFLNDFLPFQRMASRFGMFNLLSQALLKITAPGVPDFYQGTELWDYSLVDPDNRRPVDYDKRMHLLAELKRQESITPAAKLCHDLSVSMKDGRIMLYLVYSALNFRKINLPLFEQGEYFSIEAYGRHSASVVAFERRTGESSAITAVPRFLTRMISGAESLPFGKTVWQDTALFVSAEAGTRYRNIFTSEIVSVEAMADGKTGLKLSEVFVNFPVALLERVA